MTLRAAAVSASKRSSAAIAAGARAQKADVVAAATPAGEPMVWPSRRTRHVDQSASQFILVPPNRESDSIAGIAGRITHGLREQTVQKPVNGKPVELADFIKAQARKFQIKELARLTGLSPRSVENLRATGGTSAKAITQWCQSDDVFRAAYFGHCGGILEGNPDLLNGLTMAVKSIIAAGKVVV